MGCPPLTAAARRLGEHYSFYPANHKHIVYVGRVAADNPGTIVRFDWPATGIRMSTDATRAWLRMDGGRNFFNISIDGNLVAVLKTGSGVRDYLLEAKDVPSSGKPLLFELRKRTEANIASLADLMVGRGTQPVEFHGVVLEEGASLVRVQTHPQRLLEFVGDSDTTGFGNLGPNQPGKPGFRALISMSPGHQDACQGWAAMASRALDAEYHLVAFSGIGVLWNSAMPADYGNLQALYPRLLATQASPVLGAAAGNGSLTAWAPSAIVIFAGGNDWYSLPNRRAQGGEEELAAACCALLHEIRALHPSKPIVVLLPSAASMCSCLGSQGELEQYCDDMERCWREAASRIRDERLFLERVCPNPKLELSCKADWGQAGHFSVQGHAKWASAVVPLLAAHLRDPAD